MRKTIFDKINETKINYSQEMQRLNAIFSDAKIVTFDVRTSWGGFEPISITIEQFIDRYLFLNYERGGTAINIYDLRDNLNISNSDITKNNLETMLTYFEFIINMVILFISKKINNKGDKIMQKVIMCAK